MRACHGGIALLEDGLAESGLLRPSWHSGRLAQLVEQLTLNQRVVGSIPTAPTITSGKMTCQGLDGSGRHMPACRIRAVSAAAT